MASHVLSESAGILTDASYFDGTDAGTSQNPGMFAWSGDMDEALPSPEEGSVGIVGPITGAQMGHNAAQPGGR